MITSLREFKYSGYPEYWSLHDDDFASLIILCWWVIAKRKYQNKLYSKLYGKI